MHTFNRHTVSLALLLTGLTLALTACGSATAQDRAVPALISAQKTSAATTGHETAVFAGGCFWGVEGVFEHIKGVTSVTAGYSGGQANTATYDQVSEGNTGHAESARIVFNPAQVSYAQLLQVYFSVTTDPTELNRQGPDSGAQYRSVIFATTPEQQQVAQAYIGQLKAARAFSDPIVTQVVSFTAFYPAEAHHQQYLDTHPESLYILMNDAPKVSALRKVFPSLYNESSVARR